MRVSLLAPRHPEGTGRIHTTVPVSNTRALPILFPASLSWSGRTGLDHTRFAPRQQAEPQRGEMAAALRWCNEYNVRNFRVQLYLCAKPYGSRPLVSSSNH